MTPGPRLYWYYADDPKVSHYGTMNPPGFFPKIGLTCDGCHKRKAMYKDHLCGSCSSTSARRGARCVGL